MKRRFSRLTAFVAYAYPVTLVAIAGVLRLVGERWWVSGAGLYVPRILFGVPLPFIVLALAMQRRLRLLVTQLAAGVILLFPLMGLVLPRWPIASKSGPTLRVLSLNAKGGQAGADALLGAVDRYSPDIVLMQEIIVTATHPLFLGLEARYKTVSASSQFIVASRFALTKVTDPDKLLYDGRPHSPRFERYVVETPLGAVALYNVHPVSPRPGFYTVRGRGLRREILSGRFFAGAGEAAVQTNSGLRALQVEDFETLAEAEMLPVLIAGDTNLPDLSPLLTGLRDRYQDGFREAGAGFGYTFPSGQAWMRIDRMFASSALRFLHFEVGCPGASDHLCIVADISSK